MHGLNHERRIFDKILYEVDSSYILKDNIDTINKNTETLIDVSDEVGLEGNVSETECRPKSGYINSKQILLKCNTVQVFGNGSNKSKF
jgi:hypothetical protein